MEYLDIVDEENQSTGEKEIRKVVHEKGLWHREVALWLMNEKGEILLQKRAANKKASPNKWGLTAGHIDAGEDVEESMYREAFEEIGISLKNLELAMVFKIQKEHPESNTIDRNFKYLYFARTNAKVEEFTIQTEELSEVKYISLLEIEQIVENQDQNYTFYNSGYMPRLLEFLKRKAEEK